MIYQESQINNLSNFQIVVVPLSVVGGVGGPASRQAQLVVVLYICHTTCGGMQFLHGVWDYPIPHMLCEVNLTMYNIHQQSFFGTMLNLSALCYNLLFVLRR